jgi:hypothetical protein
VGLWCHPECSGWPQPGQEQRGQPNVVNWGLDGNMSEWCNYGNLYNRIAPILNFTAGKVPEDIIHYILPPRLLDKPWDNRKA